MKKIKTYVLTVSRNFPATHPRKGESTYFEYKVLTAVYPRDTYFPVKCEKCGWESWSHLADGGGQIADTGDYSDVYCPKCGSLDLDDIAQDNLTYYRQNENVWAKLHTIRSNYDLWKKRIDEVNEGEAILSLRYWSGKPYNSKQVEFMQLTNKDGIGVQEICFDDHICDWSDTAFIYELVNDNQIYRDIKFSVLSGNDGLSIQDFKDWFKGYDLSEPMAIIHFTKFRY